MKLIDILFLTSKGLMGKQYDFFFTESVRLVYGHIL